MATPTLSPLLPNEDRTWLLRACLGPHDLRVRAWAEWSARAPDIREFLRRDAVGLKRLAPLLYHSLKRAGSPGDPERMTYLRMAYVHEEIRGKTFWRHCERALRALQEAEIDFLVLRGAALAEHVYAERALRHCHDLDLWASPSEIQPLIEALNGAGFASRRSDSPHGSSLRLTHEEGVEVRVHPNLLKDPRYRPPVGEMWRRSVRREIAAVPVRILGPSDMLLHVCGHAASASSRHTLRWVADAWLLIASQSGRSHRPDDRTLDWPTFLETSRQSRLSMPLHAMLTFLADALLAPVPPNVLEELAAHARSSPGAAASIPLQRASP